MICRSICTKATTTESFNNAYMKLRTHTQIFITPEQGEL